MTRRSNDGRGFLRRNAKRIAVAVVGGVIAIAGVFMLVLPGPGILTIAAGLAIMASEFEWAERRMEQLKDRAEVAAKKAGVPLPAVVAVGIFLAVAISVGAWLLFR